MSTLAERFAAAVDVALALDTPAQILRRILADNVDTGLRAANYEARVTGGSRTSHPERMTGLAGWDSDDPPDREPRAPKAKRKPRRPAAIDDALALRKAGDQVLEATMALLAVCVDRGPGDLDAYGWAEAVKDAYLLDEMGVVATAIDLDRDGACGVVVQFCDGVDELKRLAKRWPKVTGRAPTDIEAAWTDELADGDCCRICLNVEPVGVIRVKRRKGEQLCRVCGDLRRAAGGIEPPTWLVGIWHDCDRRGQSVIWRNARSRWLEAVGVRSA